MCSDWPQWGHRSGGEVVVAVSSACGGVVVREVGWGDAASSTGSSAFSSSILSNRKSPIIIR